MKKFISISTLLFGIAIGCICTLCLLTLKNKYERMGKRVEYRETVFDNEDMSVVRTQKYKLNEVRYDTIAKRSDGSTSTFDIAPTKPIIVKDSGKYVNFRIIDLNDVFTEDPDVDWNHACMDDIGDSILKSKGIYYNSELDAWVQNIK